MTCRLCRQTTEEDGAVSLKTVDQDKLQAWALQNTGNRMDLRAGSPLACWSCVRSARMLAECFGSVGLDWWTGLDIPPDDDLEDEQDDEDEAAPKKPKLSDAEIANELKPCYVCLRRLSGQEIVKATGLNLMCSVKLEKISEDDAKGVERCALQIFQCVLCRKRFTNRRGLKMHLHSTHSHQLLDCKYCPSKKVWFETSELLNRHCEFYHFEELQVSQLKLICNYCELKLESPLKLKLHIASVHPNLKFKCSDCEERFSTLLQLNIHSRKVHAIPRI